MERNATKERRRGQRVDARLQIELQFGPGSPNETASTLNISSNGAYFKSTSYFEPLTKLALRMVLPTGSEEGQEETVECQGIVVRCVPEKPRPDVEEYEIACYFTETSDDFRERLGQYVQRNL